jgi:hypothetical protein
MGKNRREATIAGDDRPPWDRADEQVVDRVPEPLKENSGTNFGFRGLRTAYKQNLSGHENTVGRR